MRPLLLYIIVIFFLTGVARGQVVSDSTGPVLEKLYSRLSSNIDDNDRLRINDSIKSIIDSYVLSDTIFDHSFTNLRNLGQITSRDSLLKIITWNLVLENNPSLYFSYFIRKPETGNESRVVSLTATYREVPIKTDTVYTEQNWYGALYYDLRPYTVDSGKYWILLGIDYGNLLITRKIIEVLSFTDEDSMIFGKRWFESGEEIKFRDVFEYSSNGMMSLRFGSDESIVFDHLVPFSPAQENDRQYYGPDYSYDAYLFENDLWKLTINVDARNKE